MMSLSPTTNTGPSAYDRMNAGRMTSAVPSPGAASSGTAFDRRKANAAASTAASGATSAGTSGVANAKATQANDATRPAANAPATKASPAAPDTPDVATMMSTLAMVNAGLGSLPATLAMMTDIAVASGSGTLSDADRATIQAQYAQLSQQFASTVGSANAGAGTSPGEDSRDSDAGQNSQTSDDRRSTLTRTQLQAPITVQRQPIEHLVTTTKMVQVAENTAPRSTPAVSTHTHELHVGTDSYEPVAVKQTQTRLSRPATFAQVEQQSVTHLVAVAQVSQIRQLSEVAQVAQVSVVV